MELQANQSTLSRSFACRAASSEITHRHSDKLERKIGNRNVDGVENREACENQVVFGGDMCGDLEGKRPGQQRQKEDTKPQEDG